MNNPVKYLDQGWFSLKVFSKHTPRVGSRMLSLDQYIGCLSLAFCCYQQGCKGDLSLRDRDETETFGFWSETRPRLRPSCNSTRPRRDRDVWFLPRDRDRDLARPRPRRFSRPSTFKPFGHNRHGPKIGGGCAPFFGGLGPHLTQCRLGRGLPP